MFVVKKLIFKDLSAEVFTSDTQGLLIKVQNFMEVKLMSEGQNIAYIRVSTIEQNTASQKEAMKNIGIDKYFEEKISAKNANRPELQKMLEYARNPDTVFVKDFSRLARSTKDLLCIVEGLTEKGVRLVSLKENLDTNTPTGKMMLTVIGAIYEFERANLLERQKEGIAVAKNKGKYKGRKAVEKPANWDEVYAQWETRKINGSKAMKLLGLKETTFYKFIKEVKNNG